MKYFLILLLFVISLPLRSQNTFSDNTAVSWVNELNGLRQLNVKKAIADDNGFIWISTQLGLYRYDWTEAKLIELIEYPNLSKQRIEVLVKDSDTGIIYFRTNPENHCYSIQNNTIKQLKNTEGMFIMNEVFINSNHKFYKYCVKYHNQLSQLKAKDRFCTDFLTDKFYYFFSNNTLTIIDNKGVSKVVNFPKFQEFFYVQDKNTIFILGKNKRFLLKEGQLIENAFSTDKLLDEYIKDDTQLLNQLSAVTHFNKSFFISYKDKFYKIVYQENKLQAQFLFENPVHENAKITNLDSEKIFLCGSTTQGLCVIRFNQFNTIYTQKNPRNLKDYAVIQLNNQWYNYNGWVFNSNENKLTNRLIKNNTESAGFLLEYKGDFFYETSHNELVSIKDLKTKAPFKVDEKFLSLRTATYLNKQLWVADEKNVAVLQGNRFQFDTTVNKMLKKNQIINDIYSFNNQLIFTTTQGVFIHKPFSNHYQEIKGLENVFGICIKMINKSTFWLGCYGQGLFLVKDLKAYKVSDKSYDFTVIYAIQEDRNGNIWVSTDDGLFTLNKNYAINQTLNNKPVECYFYFKEDGLPTNEFNGGGTTTSLSGKNEIIGFPTMKGFVWFEPSKVAKRIFNGTVIIDEILVDNKKIKSKKKDYYDISKEAEIIAINFNYSYSSNKRNLKIDYKFDGQDQWTKVNGKSIQIPRFKKGEQKLNFRIHTLGCDSEHDVVKTIVLNFHPRNYETAWFWGLIFMLCLSVVYAAFELGIYFRKRNSERLDIKIQQKTAVLQQKIAELSAIKSEISEALVEKDTLLKEVHHRVKNNLQLIMSMFNIQARRKNYSDIFEFLKKGETRVNSMALIHQRLYQSEQSDGKIELNSYLQDLIQSIKDTYVDIEERIRINYETNNLIINVKTAIPLALIINELLSNAMKHAFPDENKGKINIQIVKLTNNQFQLVFEDNGIGINQTVKNVKSFGIELINLMARQLNGNVQIDTTQSTKYMINFEEKN